MKLIKEAVVRQTYRRVRALDNEEKGRTKAKTAFSVRRQGVVCFVVRCCFPTQPPTHRTPSRPVPVSREEVTHLPRELWREFSSQVGL